MENLKAGDVETTVWTSCRNWFHIFRQPCCSFVKLSPTYRQCILTVGLAEPKSLKFWHLPSYTQYKNNTITWHIYLSLRFNGHFPGEPGSAGVYWSKGWQRWWWQLDYWSYKSCKAPVQSSPPTNQHPVFYRPDALPVAQPTVSKHWRENHSTHIMK